MFSYNLNADLNEMEILKTILEAFDNILYRDPEEWDKTTDHPLYD
jgi:hypothetical protein